MKEKISSNELLAAKADLEGKSFQGGVDARGDDLSLDFYEIVRKTVSSVDQIVRPWNVWLIRCLDA